MDLSFDDEGDEDAARRQLHRWKRRKPFERSSMKIKRPRTSSKTRRGRSRSQTTSAHDASKISRLRRSSPKPKRLDMRRGLRLSTRRVNSYAVEKKSPAITTRGLFFSHDSSAIRGESSLRRVRSPRPLYRVEPLAESNRAALSPRARFPIHARPSVRHYYRAKPRAPRRKRTRALRRQGR